MQKGFLRNIGKGRSREMEKTKVVKYNIIRLEKKDYQKWDRFCLESKDAWFWHTTSWLKYMLALRRQSVSKSFFVEVNSEILAICLLVLHDGKFWSNNKFCLLPALANISKKERKKIERVVHREIERLARENNVKNVYLRYIPLAKSFINSKYPPFNNLLKYGFIIDSWSTQVIDLKQSLKDIYKEVRHGHKSDIKKACNVLKEVVFDRNNITKRDFELYRELHHKDAGRVTRPALTFDMMYEFIKSGNAFLIGAGLDGGFVGFAYFFKYKNRVYYGSSATSKLRNIPIGHFLLWEGIKYMREQGVSDFEIGHQYYEHHQIIDPSEKEKEIGRFKQGFGGCEVPVYIGRKTLF